MFFLIKTLHFLGIALLAGALLCQSFLFSKRQRIGSDLLQDLRLWTSVACYVGLFLALGTGLQMALSTGLFLSEDDFWLRYKTGLFVLFALLVIVQQFRLSQAKRGTFALHSVSRKKWLGALVVFLFCVAVYISAAKPYLLNDPTIVFETIEIATDSEEIEEIEELEEVETIEDEK